MRLDSALARSLRDHGTDTIFGLLADPTMRFADSFVREHGGTYISAIHEAGATHMAYGYGVASGRLGVGLIDLGPGLTNSLTAVVDAVKARVPLLLLYPDTNVEMRHHRQSVPQREFIVPTGAGFEEVRSVRTALMDLALAIRRTLFEHRPIALNIPREFLPVEIEYERTVLDSTPVPSVVVDEESLDMAVGIIASSRRPVVVAGRGAITARSEVLRLAERIGAPVATSLGAKDLFRGEPFDLGIMGNLSNAATLDVISEADCIVAIGAGLNDDTTAKGSVLENKRTIHCDINPARLGNFSKVDSMVLGDAADIATRIVEWLDEGEIPSSSFRSPAMAQKLQEERARVDVGLGASSRPGTVELRAALRSIDEAAPANRIVVGDPGRHSSVSWPEIHVQSPRDFILTGHFGAIGTGVPIAIGAGCADRRRLVLAVCGDGAFMLGGLSEFNSAVRHGVDLVVIVCNDGSYGPEYESLVQLGIPPDIVEFDWPDLGPVADALGGQGITVRSKPDLEAACALIANHSAPVLVDLKLDPDKVPPTPR